MDSTRNNNLQIDETKTNTQNVVNVKDIDFHLDSYEAFIKNDGCINFIFPSYSADDDSYLHICELDEFIVQLQQLSAFCKNYFGPDWGDL